MGTPSHGIEVLKLLCKKNFWYQTKTPLNEVESSGESALNKNFWYQQLWRKMILHSIK